MLHMAGNYSESTDDAKRSSLFVSEQAHDYNGMSLTEGGCKIGGWRMPFFLPGRGSWGVWSTDQGSGLVGSMKLVTDLACQPCLDPR
jgi:hypothetical protein